MPGGFHSQEGFFPGSVSSVCCCYKVNMPWLIILRSKGMFFQVLLARNPTVRNRSKFNRKNILPLAIISPSFGSLRSLGAEKRIRKVWGGFVCLGHKTGSWYRRSAVLNLNFTQLGLPHTKI